MDNCHLPGIFLYCACPYTFNLYQQLATFEVLGTVLIYLLGGRCREQDSFEMHEEILIGHI